MTLNLPQFYRASNPSKPLNLGKAQDRKYYIDFSSVTGTPIRQKLERTITHISPDEPTFQLFTGHIGCGKSTELLRLKHELEKQGYHAVYFESSQDLDMADVDVVDILLSIASHVTESLESIKIRLKPGYFAKLLQESIEFLTIPIELGTEAELSFHMGRITAKTKESPKLRCQLRQYLRPLTENILEAINEEIFGAAIKELRLRGKKGLVMIIDNLDRVDIRPLPSGRSQPEYLFIDRGEYLKRLKCHIVCTVPLALIFSNEVETLKNRLGGGIPPSVLPMVPLKLRDGSECAEGINLLRQMVLIRAFPDLAPEQRIDLVTEIFDSPETLERLCRISGGHVRNLLGLLFGCLRHENPPFSRETLEGVIRESRNYLTSSIDDDDWELLRQVAETQRVRGEQEYQTLLRSMYVFEYRDLQGSWFDINPVLAEVLAEVIEAKAKPQELVDKALAKVQQFFRQTGATTSQEENVLQVTSVSGRLKSYTPLPVMFAEQPVDQNVTELIQYSAQLAGNSQYKVSILLYRNPPDTSTRLQMAQVRARDHFVLIPIPFAAVEQALTDEATSIGLLAQYSERYLPGADLFDDRNAIGDTLCFFGRGNLMHSLEEDLRRIQGIGLFGLRKSGKTSLLLQLGFAMRQHPVVHIDLQRYGGKLHYGAELFNQILEELSKLLKKRTPSSVISFESFERDRPAADLTTDFARKVRDFDKLLIEAGYQQPILLFLDEIERILPTEVDPRERVEEFNAFFGVLRELSQIQQMLSLLIADVHPDFNRINQWSQVGVPTNPVFSFFKEVFVSPFSQEETTEMLTEIGKLMGVAFDEESLVAIHRESGGHPFIARQLASLLCKKVDKEKSDKGELITLSSAKRYLNRPFKHSGILKDYFEQNIWADLQKRNFASAMALLQLLTCNEESGEGIKEETLLERLSDYFSESECTDALLWLEAVGLVAREELEDDDSYRIQVLLMSRWLRMQMKPEEIHQWQLK
ncbi:ATP-binding protein [Microcoleus sp. FACHB-53]|nr:ATP-binding protein [Microcoleus sp. FACHB-53]